MSAIVESTCGKCRAQYADVIGINVHRAGGYCTEACATADGCYVCPGCQGWHSMHAAPVTTTRGVFCGERCVANYEVRALELHREREHRPAMCRVCREHPSTPAFTWCCSVNCERQHFASAAAA